MSSREWILSLLGYEVDSRFYNLIKIGDHRSIGLLKDLYSFESNNKFRRFKKYKSLGRGVTKYKFILKFGRAEGLIRWENYRTKQSIKNTFEFKKEKYGWDREKFDSFNKSRSTTLANHIKRYGKELGIEKFNLYRNIQKDAGCTLEWFTKKYGDSIGKEKYEEVCSKKAISLNNFIRKYGEDEGLIKFEETIQNVGSYASKPSQELFWSIYNKLDPILKDKVYFQNLNKEFGKMDISNNKYYKYDFVITNIKLIIEYNGDYWHANPNKYKPDQYIRENKVSDIWKSDHIKQKLVEDFGFKYIIVWESDYNANKEYIIERCMDEINKRYKLYY